MISTVRLGCFLITTGALLALPLVAEAQQARKLYRIGWLSSGSPIAPPARNTGLEAFVARFQELGYAEGRNLVLERRYAEGNQQRLAHLAADLAGSQVDLIVVTSTSAASEAGKATRSIPIVMGSAANPVAAGLVANLARPGGNITGLTLETADITAKRLELLKEALPSVRLVGAMYPGELRTFPVIVQWLKDCEIAARALGIALKPIDLGFDRARWDEILRQTAADGVTAVMVLETPTYVAFRIQLAELAIKHRIAAMFGLREQVEAGGLMAYGADIVDLYRRAAEYADRILKGTNPGDLPIEQPTKFTFAVNLRTAQAIGLTVPPAVLLRADRVIE